MTDEEDAASARTFLAALQVFLAACRTFHAWQLDPCDPLRQLASDADWAVEQVQAIIDGAEERMQRARIQQARHHRMPA